MKIFTRISYIYVFKYAMTMSEPTENFLIDASQQRIHLTVLNGNNMSKSDPVSKIFQILLPILDNTTRPFDGIIDLKGIGEINETTYHTAILYCGFSQHELIQRVAIIGTGPLLKHLTEFIARVSNKGNGRVRSFSTKEDADLWLDSENNTL